MGDSVVCNQQETEKNAKKIAEILPLKVFATQLLKKFFVQSFPFSSDSIFLIKPVFLINLLLEYLMINEMFHFWGLKLQTGILQL